MCNDAPRLAAVILPSRCWEQGGDVRLGQRSWHNQRGVTIPATEASHIELRFLHLIDQNFVVVIFRRSSTIKQLGEVTASTKAFTNIVATGEEVGAGVILLGHLRMIVLLFDIVAYRNDSILQLRTHQFFYWHWWGRHLFISQSWVTASTSLLDFWEALTQHDIKVLELHQDTDQHNFFLTYRQVLVSVTGIIVLLVHNLLYRILFVITIDVAQALKQLRASLLTQSLPHHAYD